MNHRQPSLKKTGIQITLLTSGTAIFGALLAFLFLTVINPLPQEEASVQELDTASIILFCRGCGLGFCYAGHRVPAAFPSNWDLV
jgi:Na+/H+-dicarboxylate symporter